jgi:hypothetical protein
MVLRFETKGLDTMVHDVFVSYSTKDKTITDSIVASLEQNQIRCWYAPRDIKPSEDWGNAISNAIEESKMFLIIFSGNSNQSRRVVDELNLAIAQELTILPFRIEKLEPDGALRLHLSSRHWLDAYDPSWESHIRKLINTISSYVETTIAEEDVQVPAALVKKQKGLKNKRIGRILAGIAAAALVITAGWVGLTSLNKTDDDTQALNPVATEQVITPQEEVQPTQEATHTVELVVQPPQFSLIGPPEWQQSTTSEFSIWLPPSWVGGDTGIDMADLMDEIEAEIPEIAEFTQQIRNNPDLFIFWGFDRDSEEEFLTNLNITRETVPNSITVQDYVDVATSQLPEMMTIVSTNTYMKGDYQAGEIVIEWVVSGQEIQQILFLLKSEATMYAMTCSTGSSIYDQRISVFRQIFEFFEVATGP